MDKQWIVYCCGPLCHSEKGKVEGVTFHEFPSEGERRLFWLKNITVEPQQFFILGDGEVDGMTTRRSRLQIRPNTGYRGSRESNSNSGCIRKSSSSNKDSLLKQDNIKNSSDEGHETNNETIWVSQDLDSEKLPQAVLTKCINVPEKEKSKSVVKLDDVLNVKKQNSYVVDEVINHAVSSSDIKIVNSAVIISDDKIESTDVITPERNTIIISDRSESNEKIEKINTITSSEKLSTVNEIVENVTISSEQNAENTIKNINPKTTEHASSRVKSVGRRRLPRVQPNIREAAQRSNKRSQKSLITEEVDEEKNKTVKHIAKENISPTVSLDEIESPVTSKSTTATASINKQLKQQPSKTITSPEKKVPSKLNDVEIKDVQRKSSRYSRKPPERSKMTMVDLIYWNPSSNPMSQKKERNEIDNVTVLQPTEEEEEVDDPTEAVEEAPKENDESLNEESVPGPRVMIGPNGEITIDEDSLVIRRSAPEQTTSKEVVYEESECTYTSFRKQKAKHFWTDKETAKFYRALNVVGTDFSLMQNFFARRTRQELKNKFKKEERMNKHLIDRAINDPQQFDLSVFDEESSEDDNEEKPQKRMSKRSTQIRRKRNKEKIANDDENAEQLDSVQLDDENNQCDGKEQSSQSIEEQSETSKTGRMNRKELKNHLKPKITNDPLETDSDNDSVVKRSEKQSSAQNKRKRNKRKCVTDSSNPENNFLEPDNPKELSKTDIKATENNTKYRKITTETSELVVEEKASNSFIIDCNAEIISDCQERYIEIVKQPDKNCGSSAEIISDKSVIVNCSKPVDDKISKVSTNDVESIQVSCSVSTDTTVSKVSMSDTQNMKTDRSPPLNTEVSKVPTNNTEDSPPLNTEVSKVPTNNTEDSKVTTTLKSSDKENLQQNSNDSQVNNNPAPIVYNLNNPNLPPGQLVFVASKTANQEQVIHVYVVSPEPHIQRSDVNQPNS